MARLPERIVSKRSRASVLLWRAARGVARLSAHGGFGFDSSWQEVSVAVQDGMLWAALPAVAWGIVLCWFDVRERRLPNWLTVGGAALALAVRLGIGWYMGGLGAGLLVDGFVAALAAGLVLLLPFLMRGAGGGDVKMMFASGAIVGLDRVVLMIVAVSMAGVVFGLAMLLAGKLNGARLKHFLRCLFDWKYDRKAGAGLLPPRDSEAVRVPFSVPITFGLILAMLWP